MQRRSWLQQLAVGAFALPGISTHSAGTTATQTAIPIAHFARRPQMEQVRLSPNGQKLAAIINSGDQSVLITRAVAGGPIQSVLSTDNLSFIFNWFHWVNDDRLVLSLRYPHQRQIPFSYEVVATMESRLMAIDASGDNPINVLKSRGLSGSTGWVIDQDNVIDWLPDDGKHVLLLLPETDQTNDQSVYKVDVYTGQRQHVHESQQDVRGWVTDRSHRVRIGYAYGNKSMATIRVCDPQGDNWRVLSEFGPFSASSIRPLGFGLDPNILYVRALHEGLQAVHTVDLRDAKLTLNLKLSHPRFDLTGSLMHNAAGEAVGLRNSDLHDSGSYFWDNAYKAWQERIDGALPGRRNMIANVCRDETRCVVYSEVDSRPPVYYLCTREASAPKLLSLSYPELNGKPLSQKKSISFSARDGLKLSGYLSLPPDRTGKQLPLVVFPHGGPQSSDGPEFDDWVAFIADRGYAVLQVNFRGSTGYGQSLMDAGLRRWGMEMQDDLTDGVAEMVRTGVADPARIAIVGASYGGYAALMGVVKTPRLYKGAFAFAPVTDLVELTAEWGRFRRREVVRQQIGDSIDDKVRLEETSPRLHADKIVVPVVLVHGTHDRQVDHAHSVWMAAALKAKGKAHQFITLEKGDHQLSHMPYRIKTFTALETFLKEVLGPGA